MTGRIASRKPLYILIAIILFHLVCNYLWLHNEWLTMEDDMDVHLEKHLRCMLDPRTALEKDVSYPPLVYVVSSSLSNFLYSRDILVPRLTHTFYSALLIIFTYLASAAIFGQNYGLFSAWLVSLYPAVAGNSRIYSFDLPLAAAVAAAIYFLMRTRYFTARRESVVFGIALGIGSLVKGQIIFFLAGPLLYAGLRGFIDARCQAKRFLSTAINFCLALAAAGITAILWWGPILFNTLGKMNQQVFISYNDIINSRFPDYIGGLMALRPFSLDWILCYSYFILDNVSPVLFGVFILGLLVFLWRKFLHKGIVLCWLFVSYAVFTAIVVKKDRFILPLLPALAVISAAFFYSLKWKMLRKMLLVLVCSFALFQFLFLSFSPNSSRFTINPGKNSLFYLLTPMEHPRIYGYSGGHGKGSFFESKCIQPHKSGLEGAAERLLERIKAEHKDGPSSVAIFSDSGHGEDYGLRYIWKTRFPRMKIYSLYKEGHFVLGERDENHNFLSKPDSDYIVLLLCREGGVAEESTQLAGLITAPPDASVRMQDYAFVESAPALPGHTVLYLFKKKLKSVER